MTEKPKIATRLGLGFVVVLVVMGSVAGASYWGTSTSARTTSQTLQGDVMFAEYSGRAQAETLRLRRYAKEMLLSINSPERLSEYQNKWDELRALQVARLDDLEKHATRNHDKELVKAMRKELADYDAGFTKALGLIREGKIKAPQNGNRVFSASPQTGRF